MQEDFIKLIQLGKPIECIHDKFFMEKEDSVYHSENGEGSKFRTEDFVDELQKNGVPSECITLTSYGDCNVRLSNIESSIIHSGTGMKYNNRSSYYWHTKRQSGCSIVKMILKANELMPEWTEEWNQIRLEYERFHKLKEISEVTIETFVNKTLSGSNFEYALNQLPKKIVLKIKLRYGRQIEISIPHENFKKTIENLVPTITSITQSLNSLSTKLRVCNQTSQTSWTKG